MNVKKSILFSLMLAAFAANAENSNDIHTGYITSSELLKNHGDFNKEFQSFTLSDADLERLNSVGSNIEVKVYFGTWCHDSEREVPRFIKLLTQTKLMKASYYALDEDKSDPLGLAKKDEVKYTPTFIVYRDGKEIGRIIEKPKASLLEDILAML